MKRMLLAAGLAAVLVSCHQPPPYESPASLQNEAQSISPTNARPAPSSAPTPIPDPSPVEASFFDQFDRPDTTLGLGDGWDMRGREWRTYPVPLPAATDGYIRAGHFTYAGLSTVYAVNQLQAPVRRIGASGHWRRGDRGTETTIMMAVASNSQLVTDVIQFAANRSVWELSVRREGGPFTRVARGQFSPILMLDHDYRFELDISDLEATVRVPGAEITKQVETAGVRGNRVFWGLDPNGKKAGILFDFDTVWAADNGEPQSPTN